MNWQTKKLGEISTISSGATPSRMKPDYYLSGTIPWVKSGELASGEVNYTEEFITHKAVNDARLKILPQGTPILAMYGATAGTAAILNIEGTTNQAVAAIQPDIDILEPKYTFYFLKFKKSEFLRKRLGGAQPNISQETIKSMRIPVPPLSTQQQIVEKLDAIRESQELNQKEIEKVEMLFLSVVSKWFKSQSDWKVKKLEEITISIQNGYASRPISEKDGKAQIRPHNITREGLLTREGIKYVPFVRKNNYLVKKGDVIFNNTNSAELVGKTAYIDEDIEAVFSNHMTRIRADETKINPYFLATYLHTLYQSRYFQGLCTAWVNQAAINSTLLKGLKIPLPPIEEQKKIVGRLSTLKDYKNTLRIEEEKLTELFESTLNKAMRGELVN